VTVTSFVTLPSAVTDAVPNILLMGARASGKTTVGRLLAEATGRTFVDLDELVLARFPAAATVAEVWRTAGEARWRAVESDCLEAALRHHGQVVALGGGTPMIDSARRLIETARRTGRATVVYLRCDASRLAERLRTDPGDRPALIGADPVSEVQAVLRAREATYLALADVVTNAAAGPGTIVQDLLAERMRFGEEGGAEVP
jgi:shikimate kinase